MSKTRTGKRILSMLLTICMVLSLMPAMGITASAEGELTFTKSDAYNVPAGTQGVAITEIDVSGGASGGTGHYAFSKVSGPEWLSITTAGVISGTPNYSGTQPEATIRVTDSAAPTPATADITITVGTMEAASATVSSVTVSPATADVPKGGIKQFSATVNGEYSPAQTVTWSVTGGGSGTTIGSDGYLTVAVGETAASLTVTATSTVDDTKSDTATVTVTTPSVNKVEQYLDFSDGVPADMGADAWGHHALGYSWYPMITKYDNTIYGGDGGSGFPIEGGQRYGNLTSMLESVGIDLNDQSQGGSFDSTHMLVLDMLEVDIASNSISAIKVPSNTVVYVRNASTIKGGAIGFELGDSCIILGEKLTIEPGSAADSTNTSRYGLKSGTNLRVYNEIDATAGDITVDSNASADAYIESVGFQSESVSTNDVAQTSHIGRITAKGGKITAESGTACDVSSVGVKALLSMSVSADATGAISGTGGDIEGTPAAGKWAHSMGVYAGSYSSSGDATSAVTAIGGASVGNSYGMYVYGYESGGHSLYSGSQGALTATGGAADSMSYGVYAGSASIYSPGTVSGEDYGIYGYCNDDLSSDPSSTGNVGFGARDGANADVTLNVSATDTTSGIGVWADGMVKLDRRIYTDVNITGATYGIHADSFKSTVDEGLDKYKLPKLSATATAANGVALYTENDADLVGGVITASATGATSVGIKSNEGNILLRGAKITASGAAAAMQTVTGSIIEKEKVIYGGTNIAISADKKTMMQGENTATSVGTQSYTARLNLMGGDANDPSVPLTGFDMVGSTSTPTRYFSVYPRFYTTAPASLTFEWCNADGTVSENQTSYGTFSPAVAHQENLDPLTFTSDLTLGTEAHNHVGVVYFKITSDAASGSMTTGPIALNLTATSGTLSSANQISDIGNGKTFQTSADVIAKLTAGQPDYASTIDFSEAKTVTLTSTYNNTSNTERETAIGISAGTYSASSPGGESLTFNYSGQAGGSATVNINPGTGYNTIGIFCKDLTVKSGVHLVINAAANACAGRSFGIYATGNITVEEGASITVVASNVSNNSSAGYTYGIYCLGEFKNAGTVSTIAGAVTAGESLPTDSYGLLANDVTVTGGTLNATGTATTNGNSYGIMATNRITAAGGAVDAAAGACGGDGASSKAIVFGESRFGENAVLTAKTTAEAHYTGVTEASTTIKYPNLYNGTDKTVGELKLTDGGASAVYAQIAFDPVVNASPAFRHLTVDGATVLDFTVTTKNFTTTPTAENCTAAWCESNGTTDGAKTAGTFDCSAYPTVKMAQSNTAAAGTYYFTIKVGGTNSEILRIEVKDSVSALNFVKEGISNDPVDDASGAGYQWFKEATSTYDANAVISKTNHPAKTLILTDFELDAGTDSTAALTLPGDSTVYLIGNCSISNNVSQAIFCETSSAGDKVTFMGDGTLSVYGKTYALAALTGGVTYDVQGGVVTISGGTNATDSFAKLAVHGNAIAGSSALMASPVTEAFNILVCGNTNKYVQLTYVRPITVDPCNGDEVTVLEADSSGAIDLPAAPTWDGHTFLGWYCANEGAVTLWEAESRQIVTGDVYALWKNEVGNLVRTEKLDVRRNAGDDANNLIYDLYFAGTLDNPELKVLSSTAWESDIADSLEGWSWTAATKTLTLDGFELFCQNKEYSALRIFADASDGEFTVYAPDEINIVLVGDNNSVTTTSADHYAISGRDSYFYDKALSKIIVSGDGTLNVVGKKSCAIYSDLQMDGGTLNVTGGIYTAEMNGGVLNLIKPEALTTFTPFNTTQSNLSLTLHKGIVNIEGSGLRLEDVPIGGKVKFDVLPTVDYDEAVININAIGGLSQGDTYAYALAPSGILTDDHGYWIKPHITVKATKSAASGTTYYGTDGLTFGAEYEYYTIKRGEDAESHITIVPGKEAFGDPAVATGAADGIYWTGGTEYKLTSGTKQNSTDFILYMNNVDLTVYNSYNAISFGSKLELVNTEFYTGGWETADYYTGDIELVGGSMNKIGLALPDGTTPNQMKVSSAMSSPGNISGSGTLILLGGDAYNFSAGITMSTRPMTIGNGVSVYTSSNNSYVKDGSESGEPGVFAVYNYASDNSVNITIADGGELTGRGKFLGGSSSLADGGYVTAPSEYAVDVSDTAVPGALTRLTFSNYSTTYSTTFHKLYTHFFNDTAKNESATNDLTTGANKGNAAVKDMQAGGWFWDNANKTLYLNACKLESSASPVFSLPENAKIVMHSENSITTSGANAISGTGITVLNDNPGSLTVTADTQAFTNANPTVEENAIPVTPATGGASVTIAPVVNRTIALVQSGNAQGDEAVKNSGANGWYYDGLFELILRNFTYESTDAIGMEIPANVTVTLYGDNSITAVGTGSNACGIFYTGGSTYTLTFDGTGNLTTGNTTDAAGNGIKSKNSYGFGKILVKGSGSIIAEGKKYGLDCTDSLTVEDGELIMRGEKSAAYYINKFTPEKYKSNTGTKDAPNYNGAAVWAKGAGTYAASYFFAPTVSEADRSDVTKSLKDVRMANEGVFTAVSGSILAGKGGTTTVAVTTKGVTAAVPQLVWCNSDGTTGGTAPTDLTVTGLPTDTATPFTISISGTSAVVEGTYYLKVKIGAEASGLITIRVIEIQKRTNVLDLYSPKDRNGASVSYKNINGKYIYEVVEEGWSWNNSDYILTLNGIDIEASGVSTGAITHTGGSNYSVVLADGSDNKVVVKDFAASPEQIVAAIYGGQNLGISGTGKLTATSADSSAKSTVRANCGIYAKNDLTMTSGNVIATGGAVNDVGTNYSFGVCTGNGCDLTINGGSLKATGTTGTNSKSYGAGAANPGSSYGGSFNALYINTLHFTGGSAILTGDTGALSMAMTVTIDTGATSGCGEGYATAVSVNTTKRTFVEGDSADGETIAKDVKISYSFGLTYSKNTEDEVTGTMPTDSTEYPPDGTGVATVTVPTDLVRAGYDFKGWATTSGVTTAEYTSDMSGDALKLTMDSSKTLYAVWTAKQITLGKTTDTAAGTFSTATAADSPLYDLTAITVNNDGAGDRAYAVKEGSALPAGLALTNGKVFGTPTQADTNGTAVIFTVTGANGSKADVTVTFTINQLAETAPTGLAVSYADEKITGTTTAMEYRVGDTGYTACTADMSLAGIIGSTEKTVNVRTAASDDNHKASGDVAVTIKARPAAPTGFTMTKPTAKDATDGKLSAANGSYQYKKDSDESWTDWDGGEISNILDKTTYTIRYPANTTVGSEAFASSVATVKVQSKIDVTVSGVAMGESSYTYGGTAVSYTGTIKAVLASDATADKTSDIDSWTYLYTSTDSGGYSSETAPKNAGAYKLTITTDDEEYDGKQEIMFSIAPKTLTAADLEYTDAAVTKVYDGDTTCDLTEVSVKSGVLVSGDTLEIEGTAVYDSANVKDATKVTFTPTAITTGNYALAASETLDITATITAKSITATVEDIAAVDYTGSKREPAVTVKYGDPTVTLTLTTDYTVEYGDNINAGDSAGSVTVKAATNGNYSFTDVTKNFKINKVDYAGTAITGEIKVLINKAGSGTVTTANFTLPEGFKDAAIVSVTEKTDTHDFLTISNTADYSIDKDKATTKDWTATCDVVISSTNYNDYTATLTFNTIDKTELTISGITMGAASYTYGGTAVSYSKTGLTVTGATTPTFDSATLEYKYSGTGTTVYGPSDTAPAAAGTYKLTVSVPEENTTYMGSQDYPFTIEKKAVTVKPKDFNVTANGTAPTLALAWSGLAGTETLGVQTAPVFTVTKSDNSEIALADAVKTAGTYTITWSNMDTPVFTDGTGTTANYTVTPSATGTLTVTVPAPYQPPKQDVAEVIVDGKSRDIGAVTTTDNPDGTKDVSVAVDKAGLETELTNASTGGKVEVLIPETSGAASAVFVVQNVDEMAEKSIELKVSSGDVTYIIKTEAVDTEELMTKLGATDPKDVPVTVTIAKADASEKSQVNATVTEEGALLIGEPVVFTVTATYDGKTTEVTHFESYVKRSIEITAEQAAKITTAIVHEPDGSLRHVPTRIYQAGGKWYAEISSRTNSTYALIDYDASFADAKGLWYEAVVSEMASRQIIDGRGDDVFDGDSPITRAEFAALVVRALGLPCDGDASNFTDVAESAWYFGAVGKAYEFGLIEGRGDGIFDPTAKITRQEAMQLIFNAAKVAEFTGTTGALDAFTDAASVSDWASAAAQFNVGSGLVQGDGGLLRPTDNINRAESATIILRLLQKAELVDVRAEA